MSAAEALDRLYEFPSGFIVALYGKGALLTHLVRSFAGLEREYGAGRTSHDLAIKVIPARRRNWRERAKAGRLDVAVEESSLRVTWRERNLILPAVNAMAEVRELVFDEYFEPLTAAKIIELFVRRTLAGRGLALVHAAGVVDVQTNEADVYAGVGGAGKTRWVLDRLRTGRYKLLGDDRLWLSSEGSAWAYPRYLVLKGNEDEVLVRSRYTPLQRLRARAGAAMVKSLPKATGNLGRLVKWALAPRPLHVSPTEMFGPEAIARAAPVRSLDIACNGTPPVEQETDPTKAGARALMNIGWVEWDRFMNELVSLHQRAAPASRWVEEFHRVRDQETAAVRGALEHIHAVRR